MAEQRELDLPPPAPCAAEPKRSRFAGLTRGQILLAMLLMGALIWGMWVTKTLITPKQDHIVSARLSSLVGEYVQAQARSASPPAQVEAEMRRFMASLDTELQRRSAGGQIVLVGEAVLTKNVPDITDRLRQAVYASGVTQPRQASGAELQRLEQQLMAAQPAAPTQAGAAGTASAVEAMPAAPIPTAPPAETGAPYAPPAASASTFGGPNGSAGQ
jgi:hypothetical protein